MGRIIAQKVRGMNWKAKISLIMVFTMVFSTFMYQGWYRPRQVKAAIANPTIWTNVYHNAALPNTTNVTQFSVGGASTDNRLLVVAITSDLAANGTQTISSVTYGGATMTQAVSDIGTSLRVHTSLYYLADNAVMDGTNKQLAVTMTGTTFMNDVYYAVFNGVDQASPVADFKNTNNNAGSTTAAFTTGLVLNDGDQGVIIYNAYKTSTTSTTNNTLTMSASWTGGAFQRNAVANQNVITQTATRNVQTASAGDTASATISATSRWSMSAISIKAAASDITAPTVDTFTATTPSLSLNIPITAFTASDDIAVTGYMITTSSTAPLAGDAGWSGTAPTTYTVASDGSYTLYPWAKDAAGNVSAVFASPRTVLVDTTPPTVSTTTPSNGASGVALNSSVTINWSENVDCATVNTTNIGISGGSWAFSSCGTNTATFTTGGQTANTTYTVTVGTGVKDANGNNMASSYGFSYTTAAPSCITNTPSLSIAPASGFAEAGDTKEYVVTVKNNDSGGACPDVIFSVNIISDSNPGDFDASTRTPASLTLAAGATGASTLTVSAKAGALNNVLNITTIGVTAGGHTPPSNVTATTRVGNGLLHNSATTGSSKWGVNGWGITGGKYGEFICETCHTTNTTNIKRIWSTIVKAPNGTDTFPAQAANVVPLFTDTRNVTGNMGDDSRTPKTTSTNICEVCHTYDSGGTNGVKYHAYDMSAGGDPGHNNKTDCITCHAHSSGFKASCESCHGNPPGALATPATGAESAGAHIAHATTLGINCGQCHYNSVGSGATHNSASHNVTLGFVNLLNRAGLNGGQYGGSGAAVYDFTHAGTTKSGAAKTCSSIYCHGSAIGGPNTAAVWDAAAGSYSCASAPNGACHNASAAVSPTLGSHERHAKSGTYSGTKVGLALACSECHGTITSSHVNANVSWQLNTGSSKFSGTATYNGSAGGSTGAVAPSGSYAACNNIYCHSTVTGNGGGAGAYAVTPLWGGTTTCGSCHADNSGASGTGSHITHAQTRGYACGICHSGAGSETSKHADYSVDVVFSGMAAGGGYADTTPGNAYTTCTTVYCHSTGVGTYLTPPTWGNAASGACGTCHGVLAGSPPASAPHTKHVGTYNFNCSNCHDSVVNSTGNPPTIKDAALHVNQSKEVAFDSYNTGASWSSSQCSNTYCHSNGTALSSPYTSAALPWSGSTNCGSCHGSDASGRPTYDNAAPKANSHAKHGQACNICHSATTTTGNTITTAANHVNKAYDIQAGGTVTIGGYVYNAGGGTCNNISCHSGGNAQWGATLGCAACHSSLTGAHAKHTNITGASYGDTSASTAGGVYNFGCGNCHPTNLSLHADETVQLTLNNTHGGPLKSRNTIANDTGGYTRVDNTSVVCSAAYCHSRGNGDFSRASLDWYASYSGDKCGHCHYNSPDTGSHQNHVMAGIHYDNIYTNTTGLATMGTGNTNAHGNAATSTTMSCNICHYGTVTTTANDKNVNATANCSTCHSGGTAKGNAAIAAGSVLHLNGAIDMQLQGTVLSKAQLRNDAGTASGAPAGWTRNNGYKSTTAASNDSATTGAGDWASGEKTCTTACHLSQKSPVWGTATTCTSCHTTLPQ